MDYHLSLQEVIVPTKAQLTAEAFHPLRSIPFLIRTACIIGVVALAAFFISCCWPNIRAYLGTAWWCCCCRPNEDEKEKIRKEDNERRMTKAKEDFELLTANMQAGARKWKQSTASLMSNFSKARSMQHLNSFKSFPQPDHDLDSEKDCCLPMPPSPLQSAKDQFVWEREKAARTPILKRSVSFGKDIQMRPIPKT